MKHLMIAAMAVLCLASCVKKSAEPADGVAVSDQLDLASEVTQVDAAADLTAVSAPDAVSPVDAAVDVTSAD